MQFKDKVVVITGAGKGIGQTIAIYYAKQGAQLILLDKNNEGLKRTKQLTDEYGTEASLFQLDLTLQDKIGSTFHNIRQLTRKLDI